MRRCQTSHKPRSTRRRRANAGRRDDGWKAVSWLRSNSLSFVPSRAQEVRDHATRVHSQAGVSLQGGYALCSAMTEAERITKLSKVLHRCEQADLSGQLTARSRSEAIVASAEHGLGVHIPDPMQLAAVHAWDDGCNSPPALTPANWRCSSVGELWLALGKLIRTPYRTRLAKRVVRTLRDECLDHVLALNERHLLNLLTEFLCNYNRDRPQRTLELQNAGTQTTKFAWRRCYSRDSRRTSSRLRAGGMMRCFCRPTESGRTINPADLVSSSAGADTTGRRESAPDRSMVGSRAFL